MAAPWARGAEIRIVGRLHGQETVNVFHVATNTVVNDGPDFDALMLALANALQECVNTVLLPAVTSDWTSIQSDARQIYPTGGDPYVSLADVPSVGERGPTSASFIAALAQKRSGVGGRSGRGRMFLPPPGEADIEASKLSDAALVLLAAFLACVAAKFIGNGSDTTWRLGVLSKKQLNAVGGTFDNAFHPVQQLVVQREVADLSSRKVGKGS